MLSLEMLIFLFSAMLIVGVLATKFSTRLGLPALVLFLLIGMGLNKFVFFENVELTQLIGIMALIIILFEGGTQTKWEQVRPVLGAAGSLATLGVLLTTILTGFAAMYILDLSLLEGMLFGAIVGSTDAAAVFSVLGNKNINTKLTSTLEAESGSNDPMAVFLTVSFIELIQIPETSIWSTIGSFFIQMGLGLLIGLLLGKLTVMLINNIKLDTAGLYPTLAIGMATATYFLADFLGGSGLLAVYVMAVFVGNSDLMYRFSILRFNEGFAWMMQIVMFILLGLLVFPSQLTEVFWQGIILSIILMFIARPIAVFISMVFMKYNVKEKLFISWAGLKGAVPIVLATYPIIAEVDNSDLIFNAVFFVVLISALVQGSTLSWLATKLKLTGYKNDPTKPSMELINLGNTEAEIMEVRIFSQSPAVNTSLIDIELPDETLIIGIIRDKQVITPTGNSVILENDILYVLSNKKNREKSKKVLLGQKEKKKPVKTEA
ncbi:MAG: potassium/proton antiporter [Bacillota bacterium]|uniref:Potassium/proton antiporter n=1 Tax=Virgibacillus salarius TaxID=447199 RepID=A0A941DSQ9_9BACI|nr:MULTISPECIES: potassium/proton antiporter [Bacillaceae]NAZ07726.1 potassium/proton antiporter [Agaribacter marinus]MBR7795006.1 potassium/proton antiporter [Virgibacillus salarius]MCC2251204.1 potassium/proton antiporter [Virgibacillus sp. AGTR]MDY7045530.1 potassium/proton antiporter [Virgibacillus sp. M23]QRZ18713.1 potassium/proton antiporter [Virgibacillus sp. AGTR]